MRRFTRILMKREGNVTLIDVKLKDLFLNKMYNVETNYLNGQTYL